MGNDGGSIPKRHELVKEAARRPNTSEARATQLESLGHRWRHCLLTNEPLRAPVVSDALGRLFNKDGVLEFLLAVGDVDQGKQQLRRDGEKELGGTINGLKDVLQLHFSVDDDGAWVCPITQKRLDEQTKTVYLSPCGHVFAEAAFRQTMTGAAAAAENGEEITKKALCLQCSEPFATNDIIPILSSDELEIARLTLRMQHLKNIGLSHSLKKSVAKNGKKRKKNGVDLEDATGKRRKDDLKQKGIANSGTASLTAKVLEETNKKRRDNENLQSVYSKKSHDEKPSGKNNDFMTRGYAPLSQRNG